MPRFRLFTLLAAIATLAALLAFSRIIPQGEFLNVVPFGLLVLILGIILLTFTVMLQALRQK